VNLTQYERKVNAKCASYIDAVYMNSSVVPRVETWSGQHLFFPAVLSAAAVFMVIKIVLLCPQVPQELLDSAQELRRQRAKQA
jgi:hypothetical protein